MVFLKPLLQKVWNLSKAQRRHSGWNIKVKGQVHSVRSDAPFPAKPLGAYGEGGIYFTSNDTLAAAEISIRNHGAGENILESIRLGLNGRLGTVQAAVQRAKHEIT